MKKLRKSQLKLIVLAASCVAFGAGISAITSAGAATGSAASAHWANATGKHQRGQARRALRRAVHGELVIPIKTGFATVTFDRGSVESVSGQQLTLREGTKRQTYKTVTLTIPAGALVRINRQAATLSQLTAGERVLVFQGPKRTLVSAHHAKTP